MFLEILLAIGLGVTSGVFTGLIPGIHVNLVCTIILLLSAPLLAIVGVLPVTLFIIAMSVTHTFIDVIPSVFLGAPDPDMVLSVLPGHKLLFEGKGYDAVRLTQIGGLGAVVLSIFFFPLFLKIVKLSETFLEQYIFLLLLTLTLFLLLQNPHYKTLFIFCMAGMLGLVTFNLPNLQNPIFPLLTGLFGIAGLLLAKQNTIPKQQITTLQTNAPITKAIVTGQSSGFLTAVFPGLGSASAAALSSAFVKIEQEGFLVLVGAIGTVNFILSLVTLFILDKARNGAIIAVQELTATIDAVFIVFAIGTVLFAGGIASCILLIITKRIITLLQKIPYALLVKVLLVFLILLTAILSSWLGLVVLLTASAIGVLAPKLGVPRMYLMGCLLVPTLSYLA